MGDYVPDDCPSCGSQGTLYGPEPFTCLVCAYVVTPGSIEEPPEEDEE